MRTKKKENVIFLNTATAIRHREANTAAEIYMACKKNSVELTDQFEDLLMMLQVPEIAQVMLARLLEVKIIFRPQIEEFFKE